MKTTRSLFAILMLSFAFAWIGTQDASAQCNVGSNVIPCPTFVLGQENVPGTFGTFTGGEEWMVLGKSAFPSTGGDFPYGARMQRDQTTAVWNLKRRSGTTGPIDVNMYFGNSTTATGSSPSAAKMNFEYVFQNQAVAPPTVTTTNVMTLTSATSKIVSTSGGLSLVCPIIFPGPGAPCFGRVGIERTNPTYTLDVNGIGRFTGIILTSDARLKKDVQTIKDGMSVIRNLRGTTYRMVDSEGLEGFDFDEGRKPGFLAQEMEEVLPDLVYTDEQGYKGVDYVGVIPYLVEAVKNLDEENAALRAEMEDLRMQLDAASSSKGAGSLGEMRGAELFQNVPNPFNQETQINYYLPETVQNASLVVFDLNGRQIRSIEISTKGQGSVTLAGSELEAGMYIYSLLADGKEIASKRMILTK